MSPLIVFPERTVKLPLRYFGSVDYYAVMSAFGKVVVDAGELFDKRRKEVHRCNIADTHGPVSLTVPIAKPHGIARARWSDVGVSDHGAWWHVHRVTLESAYGRTPFFEYYIDRFLPYLRREVTEEFPTVAALNEAIDAELRSILMIDSEVSVVNSEEDVTVNHVFTGEEFAGVEFPAYYQVRADKQGFYPNLSILDLIFNLGPEAPLYLRELHKSLKRIG